MTGSLGEIGASGHYDPRSEVFNLLALDRVRILGQKNRGANAKSLRGKRDRGAVISGAAAVISSTFWPFIAAASPNNAPRGLKLPVGNPVSI